MLTNRSKPLPAKLIADFQLGVVQVVIWLAFTSLILDGGNFFRWSGAAAIGYVLGVMAIALKRTAYASATDRTFVRLGYLPLMIVGLILEPSIHHLIRW